MEKIKIGFIIQVDTLCHRLPNFIEKCARAGVRRVFIGLENINPENLRRRQEAAEQDHRVPQDAARLEGGAASSPMPATSSASRTTPSNRSCHDIEVIKKELPVDLLEFFYPHAAAGLGGSPEAASRRASRSTRTSTSTTSTTSAPAHPRMSAEEWDARLSAGVAALLHASSTSRRCCGARWRPRRSASNALFLITWFKG